MYFSHSLARRLNFMGHIISFPQAYIYPENKFSVISKRAKSFFRSVSIGSQCYEQINKLNEPTRGGDIQSPTFNHKDTLVTMLLDSFTLTILLEPKENSRIQLARSD